MWLIMCKYNQIVGTGTCGGYCIYDFINYAIKKLAYVVQQLVVIYVVGIVFMILLIM